MILVGILTNGPRWNYQSFLVKRFEKHCSCNCSRERLRFCMGSAKALRSVGVLYVCMYIQYINTIRICIVHCVTSE